ncbi:hypothetical protein G6F66_014182 [Rhizopus arrhizus]|nr:hypothetical protein G6F66_014182 [Rhizopus arrhizus]
MSRYSDHARSVRKAHLDQCPQGAVAVRRARPAAAPRTGAAAGPAGHAEPQPAGTGTARRRRRAVGVQQHLPLPGHTRRARRPAARHHSGAGPRRAVDGLAGQRPQQRLAPRVHGPGAATPGLPG